MRSRKQRFQMCALQFFSLSCELTSHVYPRRPYCVPALSSLSVKDDLSCSPNETRNHINGIPPDAPKLAITEHMDTFNSV